MTGSKPAPPKPAGPGPKPSGPTGPTPTGPSSHGHPIPGPRGTSAATLVHPHAAGAGRLPDLRDVVQAADRLGELLIDTLGRQFDPASGPQQEDAPWGPAFVDRQLAAAVADVRSALAHLAALVHPVPGDAAGSRPAGGMVAPGRGLAAMRPLPGTARIAAGINEALARRSR